MLLRTILPLLFFLFYPLFAENKSCYKFFPDSFKIVDGQPAFAVAKNRFVSMGCLEGKKIAAFDRFTGLCIFEDEVAKPLYMGDAKPPLYICPDREKRDGIIRSYPVSVYPGELTIRPGHEGALFSGCCKLAGIFDGSGAWFDTASIRKLLENRTAHGDVCARFEMKNGAVTVAVADPFCRCGLKPGDKVLKAGESGTPTLRKVRALVDSCRPPQSLRFVVERNGASFETEAACFDRLGGGRVSDTFLERFGMRFSPLLEITQIDPASPAFKKGLRAGDRLLMIDGTRVENEKEVRAVLSGYTLKASGPEKMLWERRGFQFFLLPTSL